MSQTLHPSIIDTPTLGNVSAPHKATTVSFFLLDAGEKKTDSPFYY